MRTPAVIVSRLAIGIVPLLVACGAAPAGSPTPTTPPAAAPATSAPGAARYPAQLLDLADWYLTLPTGRPGDPDTVQQPALATYTSRFFRVDDQGTGVAFTANAGGVTTENSTYPRSELREMNGTQKADWSNTTGTHVMTVREAVLALPTAKPDVVTAQIHDSRSDVIEIRLEGVRLLVEYDDGDSSATLDPAYRLGAVFDVRIVAAGGHVTVAYNGVPKADIPRSGSGWYFKAGSYVQSNPTKGDSPDAVGTVVISALNVTHEP